MPMLSMIAPGAGVFGTIVLMIVFGVGPLAATAHSCSRRFFLVNFSAAAVFTLFIFGFWLFYSIRCTLGIDPSPAPTFKYVWVSFLLSYAVSFIAGLPFELRRFLRPDDKSV